MYPGPDDPDLGSFVAQLEHALRDRGHEIDLAVLDRRGRRQAAVPRAAQACARRAAAGCRVGALPRPVRVARARRSMRRSSSPRTAATCATSARSPASRALTRQVVARASTVIAVSEYLRRELEERLPEARGKTEVVDSGVDLERFRRVRARGAARVARIRARRVAHRAQERRAPRGCVRAARTRAR